MNEMFLSQLTLALLYLHLFLSTHHVQALVSQRGTVGGLDPQNKTNQSASWKPPKPWNEHRCQRPGIDRDVFLTFSWGAPISESRIVRTLYECRIHLVDGVERLHLGDDPLPFPSMNLAIENRYGVKVNLSFYRSIARREVVTWSQALAAVNLLEFCGVRVGNYDEMWAYIYAEGKQIGYITIVWDPDPETDNSPNNLSSS